MRRATAHEAFWMQSTCTFEDSVTSCDDSVCTTVVDVGGRHHADAAVAVLVVVPVEEGAAECPAIFDRAKPVGETGVVLERLELTL